MKLAIDATCWNNRRGFGRFARELITAMAVARGDRQLVLLTDSHSASTATFPTGVDVCRVQVSAPPIEAASADGARNLLDLWRFRQATDRLHPDAIFFPAVYSYFPVPRGIPTLLTVHDTIAENHPSLVFPTRRSRWFWNQKMRTGLRQAAHIATVSESAKQQIAEVFRRPAEGITVIGEGVGSQFHPRDFEAQQSARLEVGLSDSEPIILYVGGLSPHKNLPTLVQALRQLVDRGVSTWRLALVGEVSQDSFFSGHDELQRMIEDTRLRDRVTFTGYVCDETLAALYSTARMLVMPSFDEGFGLPAAEAMSCGTPVAASAVGGLPEVVGDAGLLFGPTDTTGMADSIQRLLTDDALHARCAAASVERARSHRWHNVAERVFRELDQIAGPA
jgi:glycosyltransferase involved in cell wall biosynthesis